MAAAAVVSKGCQLFGIQEQWGNETINTGLLVLLTEVLSQHKENVILQRAVLYTLQAAIAICGAWSLHGNDGAKIRSVCWEAITSHKHDSQVRENAHAVLRLVPVHMHS